MTPTSFIQSGTASVVSSNLRPLIFLGSLQYGNLYSENSLICGCAQEPTNVIGKPLPDPRLRSPFPAILCAGPKSRIIFSDRAITWKTGKRNNPERPFQVDWNREREKKKCNLFLSASSLSRKTRKLEKQLEDPSDESRIRLLGGQDPEPEVLAKKIEELELRLAEKEEKLLEKDLIFEEVTRLADRTKKKSESGKEDTLELAKKVGDRLSVCNDVFIATNRTVEWWL